LIKVNKKKHLRKLTVVNVLVQEYSLKGSFIDKMKPDNS